MNHITEAEKKEYCDGTVKIEEGARLLFLMMGERLHKIKNEKLYEPYWDSWATFTMEFKELSGPSISKLIKVYEKFVLEYGFENDRLQKIGWTKLYQITRHVESKEDAEKWLDLGEAQSRQDLNKTLIEAETGTEMTECGHKNTYVIRVCEDCGDKERVYDDEESTKKEDESYPF